MIQNFVENVSSLNCQRAVKTNIVTSVQLDVFDIEVLVAKFLLQEVVTDHAHHVVVTDLEVVLVVEVAAVVEAVVAMTVVEHFTINQRTRNMELQQRQNTL